MMTVALRSLCLLLAAGLTACGGGGGAGHTITGVAASGAAIAQGTVEVKCQVGSGSTTTGLDGSYSLTIPGGQGPCLLRATDPVTKTVFHSALEKDAATPVAHITPLSDLVVARALGAEPAAAFLNPGAQFEKITPANLAAGIEAAQQAVVVVGSALDVDPLKGPLKTATAQAQGTVLDRAIDAIMATLAAADKALSQLAAALASNAGDVSASVTDLVQSSRTFLTGCPAARSGLVWVIDSFSSSAPVAHEINFSASGAEVSTLKRLSDNVSQVITAGSVNCSFVTADAREFRIADNGIGIWQSNSAFGVLVPIQPSTSLTADSLTGQYGALGYLKGTYMYSDLRNTYPVDFTKALPLEFSINAPGKPLIQGRRCDIASGSSGPTATCSGLDDADMQLIPTQCTSIPIPGRGTNSGAQRCRNGATDAQSSFIVQVMAYKAGGSATVFLAVEKYRIPGVSYDAGTGNTPVLATGLMVLSKVEADTPLPQVSRIEADDFWETGYDPVAPYRTPSASAFFRRNVGASEITLIAGQSKSYQSSQGGVTYTHHLDNPTHGLIWSRTGETGYMFRLASPAGWSFTAERVPYPEIYSAAQNILRDTYRVSAQIRKPLVVASAAGNSTSVIVNPLPAVSRSGR
jgi:hypothetical protein